MLRSPYGLFWCVLIASGFAAGGCASTAGIARPAPFPTAPLAPAMIHPTALGPWRSPSSGNLVRTAYDLRGVPYRLGGDTPESGFDCSGFVHYVFQLNHLDVPRTVAEQYALGSKIDQRDIHEGDLVFFSTIAPGPTHVGLALGEGAFIHAPGANGSVRIERLDAPYWHDRIVAAKRLF